MIQLENIHLKLEGPAGEVNILRGINLSVAEGHTVSIVGPSGSGKTTMLMVIAGLEKATSGTVQVNNIDLNTLDEDGLAVFRRETMGIVFQNFHLVPTMSALENVAIPLEFAGNDEAFEQAREGLEASSKKEVKTMKDVWETNNRSTQRLKYPPTVQTLLPRSRHLAKFELLMGQL